MTSMDWFDTITIATTIIEDVFVDCSIVTGETRCTTASTSTRIGADSTEDGGYDYYSEPTPTHGHGSYDYRK